MNISIYKVNTNLEAFRTFLLQDHGFTSYGTPYNGTMSIIDNREQIEVNYEARFYARFDPNTSEIPWYEYWKTQFGVYENNESEYITSFGVVSVSIGANVYALSFGKSFTFLSTICDSEFPMNFAEKIIDENNIVLKSAKFFKFMKSRSLTQYRGSNKTIPEIGESDDLIRGLIDVPTPYKRTSLNRTHTYFSFGSAIRFPIHKPSNTNPVRLNPEKILDMVAEIDYLAQGDRLPIRTSFPRLNFIKFNRDNEYLKNDLLGKLYNSITQDNELNFGLSFFHESSGTILVNSFDETTLYLTYKKRYDISFDEVSIRDFIKNYIPDFQTLEKIYVSSEDDEIKRKPLLFFIDYSTVHNGKNFILIDGKWATFNETYIGFVNQNIDKVNSVVHWDPSFQFVGSEIDSKYDQIIAREPDLGINKPYPEFKFNVVTSQEKDFDLLDRKMLNGIEYADLLDPTNGELIHVKMGSLSYMRGCIRQSINSCLSAANPPEGLDTLFDPTSIRNISMLFVLENPSTIGLPEGAPNFLGTRSLYLKAELIEWLNVVRENNYNPKIYIAKYSKNL